MRVARGSRRGQWAVLVIFGGLLGLVPDRLRMPAGLMVGPLPVGAVMGVRDADVRMPNPAFRAAQGIAGCLIAVNMDATILGRLMVVISSLVVAAMVLVGAAAPFDSGHPAPDMHSTQVALAVIATGPLAARFFPLLC